jgi:RimJ/RimL family protein N-acetyltransferase
MIEGSRVRLRAVERSDLLKFQEWLNDPEVTEGLTHFLPLSIEDEEKWYAALANEAAEQRPLAIEVRGEEGWQLAGNTRLFHIERVHRSAEFGIVIGDKTLWDRGYGTETLELVLEHGFDTLNLNRIYLHVYANNQRARRSYEKAGFLLEGTLRQAMFRRGHYVDIIVMGILRSEWKSRREGS